MMHAGYLPTEVDTAHSRVLDLCSLIIAAKQEVTMSIPGFWLGPVDPGVPLEPLFQASTWLETWDDSYLWEGEEIEEGRV